jgi:hypothetical protein
MNIKTIAIILYFIASSYAVRGQHATINPDKLCENNQHQKAVSPVEEFKDSLKVTFNISSITVGSKTKELHTEITEKIKDETLIYKLSKDAAISFSVSRAVEMGQKYYYYKINLYRKVSGCWENVYTNSPWTRFNLGSIVSGYGIGVEGTSSFIGFRGSLLVE